MTKAFTHGPSEKINKDIVKVVGLVDDFLRVCLMFPLGDALIQCFVEQRVKGQGLLAFKVTYENVPNWSIHSYLYRLAKQNDLSVVMYHDLMMDNFDVVSNKRIKALKDM